MAVGKDKDLGQLQNSNNHFGSKTGVSVPGGKSPELINLILSGIAACTWGESIQDGSTQFKNLINNKDNLYNLVSNIKEEVVKTDGIIDNLKQVNTNLKNILNELQSSIKNNIATNNQTQNNAITNINISGDLKDKINALKDINNDDLNKLSEKLLNPIFVEALNGLINNINELKSLDKIGDLGGFLQSIVNILNMKSIDEDNIKILSKLTSNNGDLSKLISNLNQAPFTDKINENVKKNIENAETLFNALLSLVELKFKDVKKSERTLKYINSEYFDQIEEIIDNINKLNKYSNKIKVSDKINALKEILDTIPTIASISMWDIIWSRISINYINNYIKEEIPSIFESLQELSQYKISKDIEKISLCIKSVLDILTLDKSKLEESSDVIEEIKSIIINELKGLIDSINKTYDAKSLKNTYDIVHKFELIFNEISEFNSLLPSISSLLVASFKISLVGNEFENINYILLSALSKDESINKKISNIISNLNNFSKLMVVLNSVNKEIEKLTIKGIIKTIFHANTELKAIEKLIIDLKILNDSTETPLKFKGLKDTINNFNDSLDLIKISYDTEIEKISSIIDFIDSFFILTKEFDADSLSNNNTDKIVEFINTDIVTILNSFKDNSNISQSIKSLVMIDDKLFEKINNLEKVLKKLVNIANLSVISKISEKGISVLEKVADKLSVIVDKFKTIKEEDVKGANEILKTLMKVVVGSVAVLLVGAAIMMIINPVSLLLFTAALGGFVFSILWVYSKIDAKTLKQSFNSAKDLGLLIAISGATLIFGSLLMNYIELDSLLGFTGTLGIFIFIIIGTYAWFNKYIKKTFSTAFDLGLLIAISGATLIFGSLLYHFIKFEDLFGFTTMLAAFIFLVVGTYAKFSLVFKNAMKGAKDFAILIGVSALVIIFGSMLYNEINWKDAFKFGIFLTLFTIMIGAPWILGSLWFKNALKGAKEFAIIIGLSAALLILGPWAITDIFKDYTIGLIKIAVFALILGLFVSGVSYSLSLFGKNGAKIMLAAIGLAIVTGICAAALIYGPLVIQNDLHGDWGLVVGFAVGLGVYITVMIFILKFAGKKFGDIILGGVAVFVIGLLSLGAAYVVKEFYEAIKDIKHDVLLKGIFKMIEVFGAVGLLAAALGALVTGPQVAVLAAGAAALGVLEGLVWGAAKVMEAISKSMIMLNIASSLVKKGKMEGMMDLINGFGNILKLLCDKISLKMIGKMTAMVVPLSGAIWTLSLIANVVRDWANMYVPDIDPKTGKINGYRKLSDEEIDKSIENIGNVLTAIGTAVVNVIDEHKDLFGEGFLSGKSPFEVAMKSFKYSGQVLSGIAQGIKDWSSFAIPVKFDSNTGKPTEWSSLNSTTLTSAQDNIKSVLLAIGQAIVQTVQGNENIFGLGKNSPALIASQAISTTSGALSNITGVIEKFASKDFETIVNKLDSNDPENPGILQSVSKAMSGIIDIVRLFLKPEPGSRGVLGSFFLGDKPFAEYLNDNKDELIKAKDSINEFSTTLISIFGTLGNISKSYVANQELIKQFSDKNKITIIKNAITNVVELFNVLLETNKSLRKSSTNINALLESFDAFSNGMIKFVLAVNTYNDESNTHLNLLIKGMNKLIASTSKIFMNLMFKDYVNDVSKFVETINSLDIDKLSSMNSLVESMNNLAAKFDSMDKFVDTLANRITVVLSELVAQLRKAEATINNAHELQKRRKQLIEDSVKTIREIMSQHMVVEVLRGEGGEETPKISGGGTYNPPATGTPTQNNEAPELSSPENTESKGKDAETIKESKGYGGKGMTVEEFKSIMNDHMNVGWTKA